MPSNQVNIKSNSSDQVWYIIIFVISSQILVFKYGIYMYIRVEMSCLVPSRYAKRPSLGIDQYATVRIL